MYFTIMTTRNPKTLQNQYHARFISNGQIIWWTENYASRENAEAAIRLIKSGGPLAPTR